MILRFYSISTNDDFGVVGEADDSILRFCLVLITELGKVLISRYLLSFYIIC